MFAGFHQVVVVNTGALPATGVLLQVGSHPAFAIGGSGKLAAGQAWTCCVDEAVALADISLANPVGIVAPPIGAALYVGGAHTMQIQTACGAGSIHYQWSRYGLDIAGATNSTYAIADAQLCDAGDYACTVTDDIHSVVSGTATVSVSEHLAIDTQPAGQNAYVGDTLVLAVTAHGGMGATAYQWYKNNVPIGDATSSTLQVVPLAQVTPPGSPDWYACLLSDAQKSALWSDAVDVNVADPIVITGQPAGACMHVNDTCTFTVTAGGGYGALSYQWIRGGIPLDESTEASYTKTGVQSTDSGYYLCAVKDGWSTTRISNPVELITGEAIAIDEEPAGIDAYTGQSHLLQVTTTAGTGSVGYQWKKDGVNVFGATGTALAFSSLVPEDSATYTCVATDCAGSAVTQDAVVRVVNTITFTRQPESTTLAAGQYGTLTAEAGGGFPPLRYQWMRNGIPLSDATGSTYAIASAGAPDIGTYACSATDAKGTSLASQSVFLGVEGMLALLSWPQSVTKTEGEPCTFEVTVTGAAGTVEYHWLKDSQDVPGIGTANGYAIASVTPSDMGAYTCEVTDSLTSITTTPATLTVVSGFVLPLPGLLGLSLAAAACMLAAIHKIRR